jgi:hypothetical protein
MRRRVTIIGGEVTLKDSFDYGESLEQAYKQGGAGTYTRSGNTWTKQ